MFMLWTSRVYVWLFGSSCTLPWPPHVSMSYVRFSWRCRSLALHFLYQPDDVLTFCCVTSANRRRDMSPQSPHRSFAQRLMHSGQIQKWKKRGVFAIFPTTQNILRLLDVLVAHWIHIDKTGALCIRMVARTTLVMVPKATAVTSKRGQKVRSMLPGARTHTLGSIIG